MAALECSRERLQSDVVRAAVACEDDDRHVLVRGQRMPASERALCGLDATGDRGRVLERDVQPRDVPGSRRVARRRDLQASGRVHDDRRRRDRAQHGPDDHRDPAALTQRVPAAERLHAGLVAHEGLQTGHDSPRTPTYAAGGPVRTARMSAGWRSRPPRP